MMSKNQHELDEHLAGKLRLLAKVSPLNSDAVSEERQKFLAQAAVLRATAGKNRQSRVGGFQGWLLALRSKPRLALTNPLVALILTLALILGSTGATVYAAQGSLPDEFLYPVKMLSEDARLALATSSTNRLELMLDFSNQRFEEIAELHSTGKDVPEATIRRAQQQLDSALQIAAEMNDQQLLQALAQIRNRAEVQTEQMTALMGGGSEAVDPVLAQLQTRLQEQVQYAAEGEANPESFRQLVRAWTRERYRPAPASGAQQASPESPKGNDEPGQKSTVTPGQFGPGTPNEDRPPTNTAPGNGSGMDDSQPDDDISLGASPVPQPLNRP